MQSDLFPTKRLHRRGDMISTSALEENRFAVTFGVNQVSPDNAVAQPLDVDRDTDSDADQGNAKARIENGLMCLPLRIELCLILGDAA